MLDVLMLVLSLAIALAVGWIGSVPTMKAIPTWYKDLRKPSWNPPNKVFGPVWTLLYCLMATAAWIVWRTDGWTWWLAVYAVQLGLNLIWSFIFFGQHRLDAAFKEVVLLWIAILVTTIGFFSVNVWAGMLMVPYLAWVTFASFLNRAIAQLNPARN